jgi:hypothetical protein
VAWSGSEDEFTDFVDRYSLTFPQISDDRADVFTRFEIPTQPAFVLILPDGEVQTLFGAADEALLDSLISAAIA